MIVLTTLLLFMVGWPVAAAVDPHATRVTRAGESILLGSAAAVIVLELLSIAGVRWNRPSLAIPMIVIAAAAWLILRRNRIAPRTARPATGSRLWNLLDAATAVLVIAHAMYSSLDPPYEWDYFGIWGFKGHLFFTTRSIAWSTLANPDFAIAQPGHPLFAPLLYDTAAIVAGRWQDARLGLFATVFALAIVLVVRGEVAAEHSSRFRRAAITLAVAPAALSIWTGLAEPFLIAFATAGVLLVRRGMADESETSVRAGAVFLGCALMTKDEGLAFVIAVALSILLATRRRWRTLLQLWPAPVVAIPWFVIRERVGASTGLFTGNFVPRIIRRLLHPADVLTTMWTTTVTDHVFWWAVLAALILFGREFWRKERFLFFVIVLQFAAYVAQNFIVPWDPANHILFGWNRLIDQMAAVVAFTVATVLTAVIGRDVPQDAR